MNIIKKTAFLILLLGVGLGFYKLSKLYSPGSYPDVEEYNVDVGEEELIKNINKFKNINSKYIPPDKFNLQDGRYDVKSHWYDVYFYYPDTKEVIHIWTRPNSSESTKIGFVGINKGEKLGNWKDINRDFSSAENSRQKNRFESLILNPLKQMIEGKD